jgi:LAS superfamily LD-carboxypeptidase LdcB
MASALDARQLTGLDDTHLVALPDGHRLQADAARAFTALQADARRAGFELAIASSFRSFSRQLEIWNAKAAGLRPVHDDLGRPVPMSLLSPMERVHAILRYSALPGTSRHHWGTDLDVYDAAAITPDYKLELSPQEVAPGGVFDALHNWLDARIAAGESRGFFRPYNEDRGGVAPERWHLSYAPLALDCAAKFHRDMVIGCWDRDGGVPELLLRDSVEAQLPQLLARYVDVPGDWCPAQWDSQSTPTALT